MPKKWFFDPTSGCRAASFFLLPLVLKDPKKSSTIFSGTTKANLVKFALNIRNGGQIMLKEWFFGTTSGSGTGPVLVLPLVVKVPKKVC